MKKANINLSEIMKNENLSLSPKDYLGTPINPAQWDRYIENKEDRKGKKIIETYTR